MGYHLLCPADGQGLGEALAETQRFGHILISLPRRPAEALEAFATHGSPLILAEALALSAALTCWIAYLITRNCSHVDRLWSIVPPMYVAIFAWNDLTAVTTAVRTAIATRSAASTPFVSGWIRCLGTAVGDSGADPRLLLAFVLATVWGCRLTFNFWRKGGYNLRYEDYRWPEVRRIMHPLAFELFNLVFVALAQHVLGLLITAPAFVAAAVGRERGSQPQPLGATDWAAAAFFMLLLLGEVVTDEQQWAFQSRKRQLRAAKLPRSGDYKRGFRTTGMFRFSRHPNFFCEYGMWWAFYLMCAALPCHCLLGWAAAGAAGLTVLFHCGSLWITERISAAKYPAYATYQSTTSAIVPGWPGPRLVEEGGD